MEEDEIKEERRINRGNWQRIWCCVAVKSEFFPNRCFSEEHFYQAMVTKATHDQLRLRISPKTGKCMIIVNTAAIPPTGRELLRQEEQQFGKTGLCHTATLERRGNLDVLHVTSHIRVLSSPVLACFQYSLQLYIWKPSPCLVCLPAAHFPGGGIRQWHFSIISLPQWFPSTSLLTPPCNCCHTPSPATWTMI